MTDRPHLVRPWVQPPLFQPDWIRLELLMNITRDAPVIWGGVRVTDGDTGEQLLLTAESFPQGHAGLDTCLRELRDIARAHLDPGDPFPA